MAKDLPVTLDGKVNLSHQTDRFLSGAGRGFKTAWISDRPENLYCYRFQCCKTLRRDGEKYFNRKLFTRFLL